MNYSYVLLSEQDGKFYEEGAISNNASLLGWPAFVAISWNGTSHTSLFVH
jgi:hypothetical protein